MVLPSEEDMKEFAKGVAWNVDIEPIKPTESFSAKTKTTPVSKNYPSPRFRQSPRMEENDVSSYFEGSDIDMSQIPSTVQDIAFPPLRAVLWDRTPLGESIVLGAEAHIPTIVLRKPMLASLYAFCTTKSSVWKRDHQSKGFPFTDSPSISGSAHGRDLNPQSRNNSWTCVMDSFHIDGKASGSRLKWIIDPRDDDGTLVFSSEQYSSMLNDIVNNLSTKLSANPMEFLTSYCVVRPGKGSTIRINAELLLPGISLMFTQVPPLAILNTPLAMHLQKWSRKASIDPNDPTAFGYLTLNQTRKAVLLLPDDPMVQKLPVVGVWLRGFMTDMTLSGPDSWKCLLNDPLLWSVCLRYVFTQTLNEKVSPPDSPNTFLILIYPASSNSMPFFVECAWSLQYDKQGLVELGIQPRPFFQMECSAEVDLSTMKKTPDGDSDKLLCTFAPVTNLEKRKQFQIAVDAIRHLPEGHEHSSKLDSVYFQPAENSVDGSYEGYSSIAHLHSKTQHEKNQQAGCEFAAAKQQLLGESFAHESVFDTQSMFDASVSQSPPKKISSNNISNPKSRSSSGNDEEVIIPEMIRELLENQKKQMREMQDQIERLQQAITQNGTKTISSPLKSYDEPATRMYLAGIEAHAEQTQVSETQQSTTRDYEGPTGVYVNGLAQYDEEDETVSTPMTSRNIRVPSFDTENLNNSELQKSSSKVSCSEGYTCDDVSRTQSNYSAGSIEGLRREHYPSSENVLSMFPDTSSKSDNSCSDAESSHCDISLVSGSIESVDDENGNTISQMLMRAPNLGEETTIIASEQEDTRAGIPQIHLSKNSDEEEDDDMDSQNTSEDDEWLNAIEAKYLKMAQTSSSRQVHVI